MASERNEFEQAPVDAFARHELLHTASIVMEMFDRHLLAHRATESDPDLLAGAKTAFDGLYDFYQLCGRKFLGNEEQL